MNNYLETNLSPSRLFFTKGITDPFVFSHSDNKVFNITSAAFTSLAALVFTILTFGIVPLVAYFMNRNLQVLYLDDDKSTSLVNVENLKQRVQVDKEDAFANYILGVMIQKKLVTDAKTAADYFEEAANTYFDQLVNFEESNEGWRGDKMLLQKREELLIKYSKALSSIKDELEKLNEKNDRLGKIYFRLAMIDIAESKESGDTVNLLFDAIRNDDMKALSHLGYLLKFNPSLFADNLDDVRELAQYIFSGQKELSEDDYEVKVSANKLGAWREYIEDARISQVDSRARAILGHILKNQPDHLLSNDDISFIADEIIDFTESTSNKLTEDEKSALSSI